LAATSIKPEVAAVISYELRRQEGILIIRPEGPLTSDDFEALGREVDEYIAHEGALTGLMVCAESFPGWKDFAGLVSHLKFVRNNHQDIDKVAAVTDNKALSIVPQIIDLFISAQVLHFAYHDRDAALAWLQSELANKS